MTDDTQVNVEAKVNVELVDGFFMIWTKGGHKPRKVHRTIEAAHAEAERLARLNPNRKFLVLVGFEKVWTDSAESLVE